MGSTKYKLLVQAFTPYDGAEMSLNAIRSIIVRNVSSTEKLIIDSLRILTDLNMIKEITPFMYKISLNGEYVDPQPSNPVIETNNELPEVSKPYEAV